MLFTNGATSFIILEQTGGDVTRILNYIGDNGPTIQVARRVFHNDFTEGGSRNEVSI